MFKTCYIPGLLFSLTVFFVSSHQAETILTRDLRFKLLSGDLMPLVGCTNDISGNLTKELFNYALAAGYRLFDTAAAYRNEEDIGEALKELLPKHNLTRKDIFITTKLAPSDQGEKAYKALEDSLKRLDCGYIDLYLIHWPGFRGTNVSEEQHSIKRDESWQQLVKGVKKGLTKNIGVSNYKVRHLKQLLENNHGIKPAVNQVEWHPYNHQSDLLDLCNKEGIHLEAYFSLGGTGNKALLENPQVKKIAQELGKSPAQVLLRWSLQQDITVIPKAKSKKRIEENIDLNFEIPEKNMKILGSLNNQTIYAWDPNTIL